MNYNLNNRFEYLKKYLKESGEYIRNARSEIARETREKADGSPVTSADLWGNKFWEKIIKEEYPDDIFIGEESLSHKYPKGAEYIWYVDPIDGTKEYISGHGSYYTLIGLTVNGEPALGIVHEPHTGRVIYGSREQQPVLLNGSDSPQPLNGIRSWSESKRLMMRGIGAHKRKLLKEHYNIERMKYVGVTHNQLGSLFHKSCGFASNRATSYWDLCAPAAIMAAAGFATEFRNNNRRILLNNGSHKAESFYILPGDTPDDVKKAVLEW
ncbi:MAG: inositol monophosphatase family protein [Balneolales bacterium]